MVQHILMTIDLALRRVIIVIETVQDCLTIQHKLVTLVIP